MKRCAIARALAPPIIRAIDDGVARRSAVIRAHETLDPSDHGGGGETVAGRARGVVFDVEHAGEGDAVVGPAAAVREEVGRLRRAGGFVGVREVVAAADEACGGGAAVVA